MPTYSQRTIPTATYGQRTIPSATYSSRPATRTDKAYLNVLNPTQLRVKDVSGNYIVLLGAFLGNTEYSTRIIPA
jgi:hypothetical protein